MIRRTLLGLVAVLAATSVLAQPFPSRPIKVIVPLAAGGTGDTLGRLIAEGLAATLKATTVVENRPGSGGVIGTEAVAKSTPDGYTLLVTSPSHVLNAALRTKLPYDPIRDFAPIAQIADTHQVLLAHPSLGVSTIKELIALAKAKPNAITYGSAGNGSATHLNAELFRSLAGITLVHVPYKGSTQARTDLLSGQVQLAVDGVLPTLGHVRAGKLNALALTNSRRTPAAPEIPTLAEAGVPGYRSDTWYALLAPAGTPDAVLARLHAAVVAAIATPAVKEKFAQQGAEPMATSSRELADLLRDELVRWRKVVQEAGVQVD